MNDRSLKLWMVGGLLLIVGGGLSAVGATIFGFGAPEVGSWITIAADVLYSTGFIVFGVGFLVLSLRVLLIATGASGLVTVLIVLLPIDASSIEFYLVVVQLLQALLLLVSAILVLARGGLRAPISWAILPAGIWETVSTILALARIGGEWWTLVLFGLLCLTAGIAIRVGSGALAADSSLAELNPT